MAMDKHQNTIKPGSIVTAKFEILSLESGADFPVVVAQMFGPPEFDRPIIRFNSKLVDVDRPERVQESQ